MRGRTCGMRWARWACQIASNAASQHRHGCRWCEIFGLVPLRWPSLPLQRPRAVQLAKVSVSVSASGVPRHAAYNPPHQARGNRGERQARILAATMISCSRNVPVPTGKTSTTQASKAVFVTVSQIKERTSIQTSFNPDDVNSGIVCSAMKTGC